MLRLSLSLILSLMLVATSHNMAQARGASPAVDRMVICAGTQAVVVFVDASGQPTQAPHLCPDCALHGAGILPVAGSDIAAGPVFTCDASGEAVAPTRALAHRWALARAPPFQN